MVEARGPISHDEEVQTLNGVVIARSGEYVVRGVNGELYPCASDIFAKTYEEVR